MLVGNCFNGGKKRKTRNIYLFIQQKYPVYLTSSTFCTQGWGYTDSCPADKEILEREMDTEIQDTVEDTVSGKARRYAL